MVGTKFGGHNTFLMQDLYAVTLNSSSVIVIANSTACAEASHIIAFFYYEGAMSLLQNNKRLFAGKSATKHYIQ